MDPQVTQLQKQAAERPDVIGLAGGLPANELLPRDALAQALVDVTTSRDDSLQYGWPEGTEQVRRWVAERLAARGANVDPDRVIVTAGAQQALAIAGTVLRTSITVGEAAYPGALEAFRQAGATPVARGGEVTYLMVGVENPRGIAPAQPSGGIVIADEAYTELRFDGQVPRPYLADAPERTWHVGTISKTIAPGLRIGWLVPPAADHDAALELKSARDLQTSSLTQAALGRLVQTIDYDDLVGRARRVYAERAARVCSALRAHTPLVFGDPEGAFSIWARTERAGDEVALLRAALDEGVMVDPGSMFQVEPSECVTLRVSFSSVPLDRIDEGARRLGRALAAW